MASLPFIEEDLTLSTLVLAYPTEPIAKEEERFKKGHMEECMKDSFSEWLLFCVRDLPFTVKKGIQLLELWSKGMKRALLRVVRPDPTWQDYDSEKEHTRFQLGKMAERAWS